MLRMFNHLNQLYEKRKSLLINTIFKYQSRNESAKEVKKPNRDNNTRHGNNEDTSKPSPKKVVLWMRQTKQVERKVTPTNQIRMQKQVHVVKQAVVKRKMLKRKILNYLSVLENVTVKTEMRKQRKAIVKINRLEYVSVGEKVELIKSIRK